MQDPRNSIMPDFDSEAFRLVKETLMAARLITADVAVRFLEEGWTADWHEKVARWEQRQQQPPQPSPQLPPRPPPQPSPQLPARPPPQPPQPPLHPPLQRPPQIGLQDNVEDLPAPGENTPKRKIKLKDFEENSIVRTTPAAGRPSKYALKKLTEFEYVELYYFTIEACRTRPLRGRRRLHDL